jgi:ubiquinone/menaquinone biosynthesis C-methylase UbiE
VFEKLDFDFKEGRKILDVGCGDGSDAEIFINEFRLNTFGIDISRHKKCRGIKGLHFKNAGIYDIPFKEGYFDYVFLHDVLHHIDEEKQDHLNHIKGLAEVGRVCKKGGYIIIVESNRYNPLSYPHMVKLEGHNSFRQAYFKKLICESFPNPVFKHFEAHVYPKKLLPFFKVYEYFAEKIFPKSIMAYNVAIIKK